MKKTDMQHTVKAFFDHWRAGEWFQLLDYTVHNKKEDPETRAQRVKELLKNFEIFRPLFPEINSRQVYFEELSGFECDRVRVATIFLFTDSSTFRISMRVLFGDHGEWRVGAGSLKLEISARKNLITVNH